MYNLSRHNHLQLIGVKFFGLIGSGLWTLAGILQQDAPLVLVELVATVIYFIGILSYIIHALFKWGIL